MVTFHSFNERISVDNLVKVISFYASLIMELEHKTAKSVVETHFH